MADSEVIRVMRQFKASLLAGEQAQSQAMARTWLKVERRLSSEMTALAYEMDGIKRDGGTVSREMLMTNVRYRELLNQLTDELEGYTDYAERTIEDRQRQLSRLAITHGERAITTQGVQAGFNRLPVEAVQNLVGLAGDGSPLRSLLVQSWPLSAQRLTDELVSGVALGYNPRKTAKNMAQAAGASQQRMEVIARTEQLRVYREANRQSYKASGVVDGYRRLATHDRRVCAACLMDEGTFYELDEEMPEHPQGRCTMIPVVSGVPQPQWQQGQAWLEEQSPAIQQEILGKGRYYAWQNGDFELKDLVTVKPNATWGPSIGVTPLGELAGPKVASVPPVALVPHIPKPSGTPTSAALNVGKGKNKTAVESAISAIDNAHGDGSLPTIPIEQGKMSSYMGYYQYERTGKAVKIKLTTGQQAAQAAHTVTHEIGHFIDQQVLKISGQKTYPAEVQVWEDAIVNSPSVKQLQEWRRAGGRYEVTRHTGEVITLPVERKIVDYYLQRNELWARSYAQYIQHKTRDPLLAEGVQAVRTQNSIEKYSLWSDDEFEPIAKAIDGILEAVGWLQ